MCLAEIVIDLLKDADMVLDEFEMVTDPLETYGLGNDGSVETISKDIVRTELLSFLDRFSDYDHNLQLKRKKNHYVCFHIVCSDGNVGAEGLKSTITLGDMVLDYLFINHLSYEYIRTIGYCSNLGEWVISYYVLNSNIGSGIALTSGYRNLYSHLYNVFVDFAKHRGIDNKPTVYGTELKHKNKQHKDTILKVLREMRETKTFGSDDELLTYLVTQNIMPIIDGDKLYCSAKDKHGTYRKIETSKIHRVHSLEAYRENYK